MRIDTTGKYELAGGVNKSSTTARPQTGTHFSYCCSYDTDVRIADTARVDNATSAN